MTKRHIAILFAFAATVVFLVWVFAVEGSSVDKDGAAVEETSALSGQVIDTSGRPVADARVFAGSAMARTDSRGQYSFPNLPAEELFIDASARGYHRAGVESLGRPVVDLSDGEPVEGLELLLPRAASLTGRVVAGRTPIEGADISLSYVFAEGLDGDYLDPFIVSSLVSTDDDGRFSLDEIAPGRLQVLVEADEFDFAESDELYLRPGQGRDDVVIDLAPTGRLLGAIEDDETNPLVADVRIRPLEGQGRPQDITTGDDGLFSLRNLAEGKYTVIAGADGHRTKRVDDIEIRAGSTTELDLILEETRGLLGQVIEPDGTPVAQAHVLIEGGGDSRRVRTDAEGRFEWNDVAEGEWTAVASSPGHQSSPETPLYIDEEVTLEVLPGGRITGRVVDGAGDAVPEFDVGVATMHLHGEPTYSARQMPRDTVSNPDGEFDFGPIRGGRYRLLIAVDGRAPTTSDPIEVTAGETTGPITIVLETGSSMSGVVTDSDTGEPIANAEVRYLMRTPQNRPPRTRTDVDGRYELDDVPSGRSSIRVSHGMYDFELFGGVMLPAGDHLQFDIELDRITDGQPGQNVQGIGAALGAADGGFEVAAVHEDSPAALAGIREGDVITDVDGESIVGQTLDQVVEKIRGEPGASVTLRVRRSGRGTRTIEVERDRVFIPQDRPVREH